MWFLYSKQRLLTQHIWEFLQVTPGPFPDFWVGPGDKANYGLAGSSAKLDSLENN